MKLSTIVLTTVGIMPSASSYCAQTSSKLDSMFILAGNGYKHANPWDQGHIV